MKKFSALFAMAFGVISFTMILSVISIQAFAQDSQDDIIAIWETPEARVEIYKADGRYIGNPINSEGQRNQQIEVLNLEYEDGKWVGKIYSKRRDRSLDVVCNVKGDRLLLEISAGRISRDLEWTRIK